MFLPGSTMPWCQTPGASSTTRSHVNITLPLCNIHKVSECMTHVSARQYNALVPDAWCILNEQVKHSSRAATLAKGLCHTSAMQLKCPSITGCHKRSINSAGQQHSVAEQHCRNRHGKPCIACLPQQRGSLGNAAERVNIITLHVLTWKAVTSNSISVSLDAVQLVDKPALLAGRDSTRRQVLGLVQTGWEAGDDQPQWGSDCAAHLHRGCSPNDATLG